MSKKRFSAGIALVLLSSFSTPSSAIADQKTPYPNSTSAVDSANAFKTAMEKFRQDQKNFIDALKNYEAARRSINKAFKESVDKA